MKFLMCLGFKYGEGDAEYWHPGTVYGPYDEEKAREFAERNPDLTFLMFNGEILEKKK